MQDDNNTANSDEQNQQATPINDVTTSQLITQVTAPEIPSNTQTEEVHVPEVANSAGVVAEPKKKLTKKIIVIGTVLLAVLFISAGSVFAFLSLRTSPEDRLQQAIINAASVTAVTQTTQIQATVEGGSDLKGSVVAQRDVSDPANPKAKATVDLDVVLLGITIELKSEYICVSQSDCYVKYNEFKVPEELSTKDNSAFLDKWLKFDPTNADQKADPFEILGSINTVLGEIITGNITGSAKDAITTTASDGKTYTFTSSSKEVLGDMAVIKYDLQLDATKIMELNKIVADQYSIKNVFTNVSDVTDNATLWVDTANNNVVQVEINSNNIRSVITYDKYNETPTIAAPDTFLTPEQYNAIF